MMWNGPVKQNASWKGSNPFTSNARFIARREDAGLWGDMVHGLSNRKTGEPYRSKDDILNFGFWATPGSSTNTFILHLYASPAAVFLPPGSKRSITVLQPVSVVKVSTSVDQIL